MRKRHVDNASHHLPTLITHPGFSPARQSPPISAVVVTFRTGSILWESLAALLAQPALAEIIVVDNGNPPNDRKLLDQLAGGDSRLRLIRPGRNLGFAAGCNLGAAQATGRFLSFVNPDLITQPDTFLSILRAFEDHPNAWLCGGRLLNMDGSEQRGGRREVLTPWRAFVETTHLDRLMPRHPYFRRFHLLNAPAPTEVTAVPVISGAFMVIPRDKFHTLGGMDERMFLHIEDIDLCLRVLLVGGKVLYCGNAPVLHKKSTSDSFRTFVEWQKTKSTIYYFFKHFSKYYPNTILQVTRIILIVRFIILLTTTIPADFVRLTQRIMPAKAR